MQTFARCLGPISLTLVIVLGVSAAGPTPASADPRFLLGDGSVRILSVGPVRMDEDGSAETQLLLPAIRRAQFQVAFLGGDGNLLKLVDLMPPQTPQAGEPFFLASFKLTFSQGLLGITDGAGNILFSGESRGIIAILIGLLVPAVQKADLFAGAHAASFQLMGPHGEIIAILPYIEQSSFHH